MPALQRCYARVQSSGVSGNIMYEVCFCMPFHNQVDSTFPNIHLSISAPSNRMTVLSSHPTEYGQLVRRYVDSRKLSLRRHFTEHTAAASRRHGQVLRLAHMARGADYWGSAPTTVVYVGFFYAVTLYAATFQECRRA